MDEKKFPELIKGIYKIVSELETMFPGRHFTPDGHMVGSIGECMAAYYYGLELLPASTQGKDATREGKNIEIKATQSERVAFRSEPDHLIVLKLHKKGSFDEIYNGPGARVWSLLKNKPRPKNGQYQISLSRLSKIMMSVPKEQQIHRVKT